MNRSIQIIGSALILIGTAIGAGMLALPLISAQAGFIPALILLIGIWLLMTLTALLVLEVNLAFPINKNNFNTMAMATLGPIGQFAAWLTCLLLLYALTSAYIAGNASLLAQASQTFFNHSLSSDSDAILFTLVFGGIVFISTRSVDIVNRSLISIKGVTLVLILIVLLPHVNTAQLIHQEGSAKYLWAAAPIFLTSFGFHTVIPSLSSYLNKDAKALKNIIVIGAAVPLLIYTLWLICALGIIPLMGSNSFTEIAAQGNSVGNFVGTLDKIVNNHWVSIGVDGFSNIAMTTSFLGVTLGLFDFLADGFKRKNSRAGRLQTALLTFIPPLVFAIYYPKGFIMALGYGAIFVAILEIILPVLMVYKLRQSQSLSSSYRAPIGNGLLIVILLCGLILITTQLFNSL
ncbi:MAG: tyrosine-specific transport protein [Gammaproteobacteria bacterium]|jgi:aromatic amino acid transport protein|nr:tyrosine-specific transport protein [Gammaproteobacteria bacterium]